MPRREFRASCFADFLAANADTSPLKLMVFTSIARVFTQQPTNQTISAGQSANFSVGVAGGPPSYQWRHASTNIIGATEASYTVTNTAVADAGNYDVVVTNQFSSATSAAATLTVQAIGPVINPNPQSGPTWGYPARGKEESGC